MSVDHFPHFNYMVVLPEISHLSTPENYQGQPLDTLLQTRIREDVEFISPSRYLLMQMVHETPLRNIGCLKGIME
jgi:hypothetical protein